MRFKPTILLVFFVLAFSCISWGQYQDFGIWTGVKVEKELSKKGSVFGEVQGRVMQNATQLANLFLQVGGAYSFADWYELSASYRYANFSEFDVNRIDVYNTFKFKVNDNSFALRLQYQQSFVTRKIQGNRLRVRFKYSFKVNKKFKPYLKAQYFYTNFYDYKNWNRQRYSIGAVVRVAKKNYVNIFYQYENEFNVANPASEFVFGVKYKLIYK